MQYPAAFCGVTGLRPTFGRVSRHGAMALSSTMDKLGRSRAQPRTAARARRDRRLRSGGSDRDLAGASCRPRAPHAGTASAILRGTLDRTQPEVRRNFDASLELLRRRSPTSRRARASATIPTTRMAGLVLDAEAASAFEPLVLSGRVTRLTAPEDRVGGYAGQVCWRATTCAPPGPTAGGGGAGPRCCRRWTPSPRRRFRPSRGLSTPRWTRPTRSSPAVPSVAGAANLCGVPALFLMNGTGEGGPPDQSPAHGPRPVGGDAAGNRHALSGAHEFSPTAAAGIVTPARPRYISAAISVPPCQQERS